MLEREYVIVSSQEACMDPRVACLSAQAARVGRPLVSPRLSRLLYEQAFRARRSWLCLVVFVAPGAALFWGRVLA